MPRSKLLRCRRTDAVRRGKGLSGLVGRVPTPLEEGGSNDPLTFVRKDWGDNSMRMKRREAQRHGPRAVRELGHAWVRLVCLNSSPSGCDRPPPGMTPKPGFLSHGDGASPP
jgi:hypothetical protein